MIEVKNLYKVFGKKTERVFPLLAEGLNKEEILDKTGNTVGVNDANFKVEDGEIFVIMGLSGSGKSTLLRCLNRLIEPTQGEILYDNVNLTDLNKKELREFRKDKFGMVFQHFALFPYRTVQENAEFGLEMQNIPAEERQQRAKKALERVGLSGYEDQMPDQLSGGMQQRVGLARALAVETDVLLMDEPFSALDPLIKKEMQDKLLELYEELDKTIIFITHDLDEALKLGDRIAIMKDGKIIQIGNHEEILKNAENDYVRDFVQDVNRSRVLTAEDIMIRPLAQLYPQDGFRTAIHKMKKAGISSIFAVERNRTLRGIVYLEDVVEVLKEDLEDDTKIEDLVKEVPTADPAENLDELLADIANLDIPLPVVDENNKLLGVIVKTNVLANLAGEDVI